MKHLMFPFAAVIAVTLFGAPAFSQALTTTQVELPWGDFLASMAGILASVATTIAAIVLTFVGKLVGPQIYAWLMTWRVDQLLAKAIVAASNATRGAVAGKVTTIDMGNEVLAKAADYALRHGSKAALDWATGAGLDAAEQESLLREKLISRMDVPANVAIRP